MPSEGYDVLWKFREDFAEEAACKLGFETCGGGSKGEGMSVGEKWPGQGTGKAQGVFREQSNYAKT